MDEAEIAASVTSLEHRRDVAALTFCHKTQVLHTPHLTRLYLPSHHAQRVTRQAAAGRRVMVPRSHTPQHQRTYKARTRVCGTTSRRPRLVWKECRLTRRKTTQMPGEAPFPRRSCLAAKCIKCIYSQYYYIIYYTDTHTGICTLKTFQIAVGANPQL